MRVLAVEEILARVRRKSNGCIEWTGSFGVAGYGAVYHKRKQYKAHRFFYEKLVGPIPEGAYICHTCHNKKCVNPKHLYAGTQQENMRDMVGAGRQAKGELLSAQKRGVRNPSAKLTEADVVDIRRRRARKENIYDVAKRYSVSISVVSVVASRKKWKHVP